MNKTILLSLLCILCLATSVFAVPITILHTNDTHGTYIPRAVKSTQVGGYEVLDYYLKQERSKAPRSLYVDAGDQQTGSVFASLSYNGAVGGAVVKTFNMLGLDATTFGNHEFDQSYANTIALTDLATYPYVSTNLRSQYGTPIGLPYQIIKRDSLNIGIMGLTMTDLADRVKRENVKDLQISPYKQAVDKYLDELDAQTDLVILLTHIGFEADSLLATTLDNRIDLIIGGHSHVQIGEPWQVNGIYIASAGSHLEVLGKLELDVVSDRIKTIKTTLIPLIKPLELPETRLAKFVNGIADSLETEMGKVIATIPETWSPNKFTETAVSRWMANALQAEYANPYKPDIAIINNGGIRKVIPAGPVTLKDMHELLPFGNYVVLFSCYGRDILAMDEYNRKIAIDKPYDIVQTSATGWVNKPCKGGHGHNKDIYEINGAELVPDKVYRVVSHDYVLGQWEKYLGFKPFDVQETGDLILDAMIRQVSAQYGRN